MLLFNKSVGFPNFSMSVWPHIPNDFKENEPFSKRSRTETHGKSFLSHISGCSSCILTLIERIACLTEHTREDVLKALRAFKDPKDCYKNSYTGEQPLQNESLEIYNVNNPVLVYITSYLS